MNSSLSWKLRKKNRASGKSCKHHIYFTKEVMPMMKYPDWDANKKMSILNESYAESVVVSDIAFGITFLYSVGCESGVRHWN